MDLITIFVSCVVIVVGLFVMFKGWTDLGLTIVAGVFVVLFIKVLVENPDETNAIASEVQVCENTRKMQIDAFVWTTVFVKQQLKAPATAKFPYSHGTGTNIVKMTGRDCDFKIRSYVDAKNSFGANVRTRFDAIVSYDLETNRWLSVRTDIFD